MENESLEIVIFVALFLFQLRLLIFAFCINGIHNIIEQYENSINIMGFYRTQKNNCFLYVGFYRYRVPPENLPSLTSPVHSI